MHDNFGKKLQDARKKQGVSIREASDALKIRSDFLDSFENDHGNFDMPEVYKRGFIKLYARYLKLDQKELVQDFTTYHHGNKNQKSSAREKEREVLGRMALPESDESHSSLSAAPQEEQQSLPFGAASSMPANEVAENEPEPNRTSGDRSDPDTRALYLKIGLLFGGTLAVFSLLAVILSNVLKSDTPELNQQLGTQVATFSPETESTFAESVETVMDQVTLYSEGEVSVIVRQENDKQRLYQGNVQPNAPVVITRRGPIKIQFSNGSNLVIEKADGQKVRPSREGVGWIEI